MQVIETQNLTDAELYRHLAIHLQVLEHLERDFGSAGRESRLYQETFERVTFLRFVLNERENAGT